MLQHCPKLILAPMAGYSDYPFRKIAREFGADEVVTELVSANAIVRNNRKTIEMMRLREDERPASIQIFGSDPVIMAEAAKIVEEYNPLFIDINMGCPIRKIVRNGAGAALLENPGQTAKMVKAVVDAVKTPVSIKIRTGKNSASKTGLETAMLAADCGVSRITVHARTVADMFTGPVDYDSVAYLKKRLSVEIIGNGGITSIGGAKEWLKRTGCDGLMIGRGAVGHPSIFRAIREGIEELPKEEAETVLHHIDIVEKHCGGAGFGPMRAHLIFYSKGYSSAKSFRNDAILAKSYDEMRNVVMEYMGKLDEVEAI
jgi:tRNA-dihydrouridine synthase B